MDTIVAAYTDPFKGGMAARLQMFGVLRATFQANGYSDLDLWNFLRKAQTALGGMTAAEHLIGHHSVEVAQLSKRDQDEILLELAQEELWRLQQ